MLWHNNWLFQMHPVFWRKQWKFDQMHKIYLWQGIVVTFFSFGGHATCHTHTQPFNGPFTRTSWVSRYQKGKTNLILVKQEMVSVNGISWAICNSAPCQHPITQFFTGRMPFLPPNQQGQSTEGITCYMAVVLNFFRISYIKNNRNHLIFDWVIHKIKGGRFYWDTVYV